MDTGTVQVLFFLVICFAYVYVLRTYRMLVRKVQFKIISCGCPELLNDYRCFPKGQSNLLRQLRPKKNLK